MCKDVRYSSAAFNAVHIYLTYAIHKLHYLRLSVESFKRLWAVRFLVYTSELHRQLRQLGKSIE